MRRILTGIIAALAFANAVFAVDWSIRDINVNVRIYRDGSAVVSEVWDMTAEEGTEVYVPRENLGDIEISDFSVSDETGRQFVNEGRWDVDRSLAGKAGRCGINETRSGVELCWGLGSYGSHTYTIRYVMSNAVKSLNDYDMIHLQFVNDEMSAPPQHVKVTVEAVDRQIDTSWVRAWGFGYVGDHGFDGDKVFFESSEHLGYFSSVIGLVRFDKGVFDSPSVQDKDFQEVFDRAREGSEYYLEEEDTRTFWQKLRDFFAGLMGFAVFLLMMLLPFLGYFTSGRMTSRQKRKILGSAPNKVPWYRDLPFEGDIYMADEVLNLFEEKRQPNAIASAIILRLIQKGFIQVRKDSKDRIEMLFDESKDPQTLDDHELGLYTMMKQASGADVILQDKEFSRWSAKSSSKSTIRTWASRIESDAKTSLKTINAYTSRKFTEPGKVEARHLYGFKNFLNDFTLVEQRESIEVGLWKEYLVYAALFGIADKVAKELKDVDPRVFEEVMVYDYTTLNEVIRMSNRYANNITNARYVAPSTSPMSPSSPGNFGGFGGHSSFGGGGGFSGGGHGGGVR